MDKQEGKGQPTYEGAPKTFWPGQLFKATEIKQYCYFSI
jgi:hypothetical protein